MESKIFIDCDVEGKAQIRIDYKHTGDGSDLRDKMLARFIFDAQYGDNPKKELILEKGHDHNDGAVLFIRQVPDGQKEQQPDNQRRALEIMDEWCVHNLPPALYKEWKDRLIKETV